MAIGTHKNLFSKVSKQEKKIFLKIFGKGALNFHPLLAKFFLIMKPIFHRNSTILVNSMAYLGKNEESVGSRFLNFNEFQILAIFGQKGVKI